MNAAMLARAGAVAIAIAAAIDPAWTRTRPVPVPASFIHDAASAPFADALRRDLGDAIDAGGHAAADRRAWILLRAPGGPLPPIPETGPVFVVDDPSRALPVTIRSFSVPPVVIPGRTIAASVQIDVTEHNTETIAIELRAAGRLVAREERTGGSQEVALRFAPASEGLLPLRVDVTRGGVAVHAESAVNVAARKLRVLVVDPRPSWASTFVRRALEEDPAFDVSADTVTSRGVTAVSGTPARYGDPIAREALDAVIAGTPSALSPAALRDLQAFARERGGALILLADVDAGPALERLTGTRWQRRGFDAPVEAVSAHGNFALSDALLPAALQPAMTPLATAGPAGQPLMIELPLGHGRVIVSGGLDAWRYRGRPGSGFAAFWRGVVGDAAMTAAPSMSVTLASTRVKPAGLLDVEVVVRDAAPGEPVSIEGTLTAGGLTTPLRLWPASTPGVFTGRVHAPAAVGQGTIHVSATTAGRTLTAEAPLLISEAPALSNVPPNVPIVLVSARGGSYIPDGSASGLRNALRAAFPAPEAPVTSHPMRYASWLVPFTLLLGYEWRWRRQRGLK